jgi:hypothetical protein
MSNDIVAYDVDTPVFADDNLLEIARQAEARIDAVIAIKKTALKVTNSNDWVDQNGKPYLQASGSEKIANLFNISWQINEPTIDQEEDGTITYTYKGRFSLRGRSIEVEGSRSSRDDFFKKYVWENGKKVGEKPLDKRDLKMAALTNLLGNGITRLLGIRNLTYADLQEFAGITKDNIGKVEYKKGGQKPPTTEPQRKSEKKEPPPEGEKSVKDKLHEELSLYCQFENGEIDMNMYQSVLKEISIFTGKNKEGQQKEYFIEDIFNERVSDKWAGTALGKLREKVGNKAE